jgi:hypothetical protein
VPEGAGIAGRQTGLLVGDLAGVAVQLVGGLAQGQFIIDHHQGVVGQIVEQAGGAGVEQGQVIFEVGKRPSCAQRAHVILPGRQTALFRQPLVAQGEGEIGGHAGQGFAGRGDDETF